MRKLLVPIFIGFLSYLLYSFKLSNAIHYHPDLARDLHEILKITQGDFTLLGPKLTFGGLYTGPYYFYLFAPIFFITKHSIFAIYAFNAFLFSFAVGYFFKKAHEKYPLWKAFLATALFVFVPIFLIGSRNPSNAYTFLPILSVIMTYLYFHRSYKRSAIFFLGLTSGIVVNFHFLNILILPVVLSFFLFTKRKGESLLFFTVGFFSSFLPLLLFEVRHGFVIFKNTVIDKSYLAWIQNRNIPGGLEGKKNILENIFFMADQMKQLTIVNPLIIYAILGIILLRKKPQKKFLAVYFGPLISFLLFTAIIRYQFIPHYLPATAFLLFFGALIVFLETRFTYLLLAFLVAEIVFFPSYLYTSSWRKPEPFEKATNYVIENGIVTKDSQFNIIQITKENLLAPIGFEYRYFFRKRGYIPQSEFAYNTSKELLVFSEVPDFDLPKFRSWEAEQFGVERLKKAKKYRVDALTIYHILK
ncbi:hypothetical protein HYT33_03440 [Candidatus Roizmanbacteria bacterium]|nr:hypothetical protein [Candidatus Roizmanbacteria bacterium]